MMKKEIQRFLPAVLMSIAGLACGYLYYRFVGCASGSCAISSDPYISTLYGGLIGSLIGIAVTPERERGGRE